MAELPSYAVPVFVRMLPEMESTGTFKQRKVTLRNEGIDLDKIRDEMFYFDADEKKYIPYTREVYNSIVTGKSRL